MGLRMKRVGATMAAVVTAATLAAPGTASAADSDSCAVNLARGYIGDVFTGVGYDTTAPGVTRVCFRVDDGAAVKHAGVFTINHPSVTVGTPYVDTDYAACSAATDNTAPGPHPALAGTIAGVPVHADTYLGDGGAWVCVRVGEAFLRVVVPSQGAQVSLPTFEADPGPRPPREYFGVPSDDCQIGGVEYVNMRFSPVSGEFTGARLYLGTRWASPSKLDVCVRVRAVIPGVVDQRHGGRLTIDTGSVDIRPTISISEDTAGCTTALVDLTAPTRVFAGLSGTTLPASVCLQFGSVVRRVTIGTTGGVAVPVTWTPDSI